MLRLITVTGSLDDPIPFTKQARRSKHVGVFSWEEMAWQGLGVIKLMTLKMVIAESSIGLIIEHDRGVNEQPKRDK